MILTLEYVTVWAISYFLGAAPRGIFFVWVAIAWSVELLSQLCLNPYIHLDEQRRLMIRDDFIAI